MPSCPRRGTKSVVQPPTLIGQVFSGPIRIGFNKFV